MFSCRKQYIRGNKITVFTHTLFFIVRQSPAFFKQFSTLKVISMMTNKLSKKKSVLSITEFPKNLPCVTLFSVKI